MKIENSAKKMSFDWTNFSHQNEKEKD